MKNVHHITNIAYIYIIKHVAHLLIRNAHLEKIKYVLKHVIT